MARDRQRAKRRQQERRAARLREQRRVGEREPAGDGAGAESAPAAEGALPDRRDARAGRSDGAGVQPGDGRELEPGDGRELDPVAQARIAAAAPSETAGRSDTVVEAPPPAPDVAEDDRAEVAAPERARPERAPQPRERGRVVAFLVAVWAELQRVQWPDRKALTTLTGVVLGFVLIMGGYLGGLDAIFSRLVESIL